jgi:tetratricopeptide (TPR) repeat protein
MKSGLWILIVVIAAAVVVGILLRPRLRRLQEEQEPPEVAELREIEATEDPRARLSRLKEFISDYPESEVRSSAYGELANTMVRALEDTAGFLEFADLALDREEDAESRSVVYYWLYSIQAASEPEAAVETARRLLGESIEGGGIYNYVGYDLAERDLGLEIALELCKKALTFAESTPESANILDSRGWAYYKLAEYDHAVADLERAAELFDPPYEEVLKHLAVAALKGGQTDKAFETLRSILVMGEYDYARASLDSLMDERGYSPGERLRFEEAVWEERLAGAQDCEAFTLPMLSGETYEFDPQAGGVTIINFMSPT